MAILLKQLHISYIQQPNSAVWNANVLFENGNFYHIKASSGKGKSTFINTVYGINSQYKGEIFLDESNYKNFSLDQWSEIRTHKMSVVFQDLKLFEQNTAFENIEIKREQTHFYSIEKIKEMAFALGVEHTLDRKINTLSYGERQRIAIIRALMQPFDILLLDEPFSHLDAENITKATQLIINEVQKRKAILIICDLEDDNYFPYSKKLFL